MNSTSILRSFGLSVLAVLVLAPAAFAGGSPQDICKDAQDGKIDGTYTATQMAAFQNDATAQGYCGPVAQAAAVAGAVAARGSGAAPASSSTKSSAGAVLGTSTKASTLPFTGTDLGILAMLGAALVGMGLVLRRANSARE